MLLKTRKTEMITMNIRCELCNESMDFLDAGVGASGLAWGLVCEEFSTELQVSTRVEAIIMDARLTVTLIAYLVHKPYFKSREFLPYLQLHNGSGAGCIGQAVQ